MWFQALPARFTCSPLLGHSLSFLKTDSLPLQHRGLILYLHPPKWVKWVGHSPCRSEVNRGIGSWGKAAWAWGSDSNNSSSKGMEWGARGILCGAAQAPGGTPSPICWPWSGETEKWGKGLSSLYPCCRQTPPQVYPQKTLWGGAKSHLCLTPSQLSLSLKALPSPTGPDWLVWCLLG